jgi:myo-inositol-1(or 4)-monophosphatase
MNQLLQEKLKSYILQAGKEIVGKAGNIKDIGVRKQWLTEEDIRIERGLHSIIAEFDKEHKFYAEEENDQYFEAESVWIVDPISGTKLFIEGKPHYAIVVSHLSHGEVDYALVYDPSADNLYSTEQGKGIFLNGQQIKRKVQINDKKKIIFAVSGNWDGRKEVSDLELKLRQKYEVYASQGSFALNYCLASIGQFDGVVSLTKDSFPEFAGCFYAQQAGCRATNIKGETTIGPDDRTFVCGDMEIYQNLFTITQSVIK